MFNRYPLNRDDLLELNPNLVRNFKRGAKIPSPTGQVENPCWLWLGSQSATGYGHINIKVPGANKTPSATRTVPVLAHRVSYALQFGTMDDELDACHLCRKRNCVNPSHLVAENHQFNMDEGRWWNQFPEDVRSKFECPFPPISFWDGFELVEHEQAYQNFKKGMAEEKELQYVAPEIWLNLRNWKSARAER